MDKPIYKYATLWGVLGGTALAFIYLKTLGKDKNLTLMKTLLIGGGIGAGIGLGIDLSVNRKPKFVTEEDLKGLAKSVGTDAETQLNSYLSLVKLAKLDEPDTQKVFNVIKGEFLAKKDNKWDAQADIATKKQILSNYGVSDDDFKLFEAVIIKGLTNIIVGAFGKTAEKVKKASEQVKSQDGKFYGQKKA